LQVVAGEKSRLLLGSLRTAGLVEAAYWLSWFIAYVPVLAACAVITALSATGTGIALFSNCDFGVLWLGLFMLAASCAAMALCCASFVRAQRAVNVVAFLLFAVSAVCTSLFSPLDLYDLLLEPSIVRCVSSLFGRYLQTAFF
jgi:hypothetical protein